MVKHTQTIRQQQLTNCLSLFDHFVGLGLKELMYIFQDVSQYFEIHFHVKLNYIRTKISPHRNPW